VILSHHPTQYSGFQKNKAKIAAVPKDNSTDNQLKSYFQQIQQKILTDFEQDAALFYTVITSASKAIIFKHAVGKSLCFLGST